MYMYIGHLPFTLWMGSTTTATARVERASKLYKVKLTNVHESYTIICTCIIR